MTNGYVNLPYTICSVLNNMNIEELGKSIILANKSLAEELYQVFICGKPILVNIRLKVDESTFFHIKGIINLVVSNSQGTFESTLKIQYAESEYFTLTLGLVRTDHLVAIQLISSAV